VKLINEVSYPLLRYSFGCACEIIVGAKTVYSELTGKRDAAGNIIVKSQDGFSVNQFNLVIITFLYFPYWNSLLWIHTRVKFMTLEAVCCYCNLLASLRVQKS
jgi:hypothetical protein